MEWYYDPGWWQCIFILFGLLIALRQIHNARDIAKKKSVVDRLFSGDFEPLHENAMPIIRWYDEHRGINNESEIGVDLLLAKPSVQNIQCLYDEPVVSQGNRMPQALKFFLGKLAIRINISLTPAPSAIPFPWLLQRWKEYPAALERILLINFP